jgi:uncharacterized membrane protein
VTIADAAASGKSFRHNLLWVVVSLSLALNLFFVGGALWTRFHAAPPLTREERFDQMAAALALNPQQREAFGRYSQSMHGWLVGVHDQAAPLFRAAWSEMSKPQADETKVMQLLDHATQVRRAYLTQITTATIAFLKTLSAEQRADFIKIAHQGPPPWALQFKHQEH